MFSDKLITEFLLSIKYKLKDIAYVDRECLRNLIKNKPDIPQPELFIEYVKELRYIELQANQRTYIVTAKGDNFIKKQNRIKTRNKIRNIIGAIITAVTFFFLIYNNVIKPLVKKSQQIQSISPKAK